MIAIHIGMSKAGSSTIQNFFSKNRKELLYLSVDYPDVALSHNNHHNIAHQINGSDKFDPNDGTLEELISYRKVSKKPTMFISSEVFGFFEAGQISTLRERLNVTGEQEYLVILIVRDHVERMQSSYAQKIKHGVNSYDFDVFFRQSIDESRINYFSIAERWAGAFGWSNVSVRVLDKNFLINGDLIDDTLQTLRVEKSLQKTVVLDRTEIRNMSPGWRVLEAVRAIYNDMHGLPDGHPILRARNKRGRKKSLGKLAHELGTEMGWNDDKGLYLTRPQAQKCLELYRENIVLLNSRLQEQLPAPRDLEERGFHAREVLPSAELIPRDQLVAFYEKLSERWFDINRTTKRHCQN